MHERENGERGEQISTARTYQVPKHIICAICFFDTMELNENSTVQIALLFDLNDPAELIREKKWLIDKKRLYMTVELNEDQNSFKQLFAVVSNLTIFNNQNRQ